VYTVLDTLVERGLVTKAEVDGRTNNYTLTTAGERKLAGQRSLLATCLGEHDE
jgi:DNA-binding PadR family transcriptional regulator